MIPLCQNSFFVRVLRQNLNDLLSLFVLTWLSFEPKPQIHVAMYDLIHMIPPPKCTKYFTYLCFYNINTDKWATSIFLLYFAPNVHVSEVAKLEKLVKLVNSWINKTLFNKHTIIKWVHTHLVNTCPVLGRMSCIRIWKAQTLPYGARNLQERRDQ